MSKPTFAGVYPMLFAFFDEKGALDEQAIRLQTRAVLAAGAHGVAALGLASEANKMSTAERLRFIEIVQDEVRGKVPLSVTISEASVAGQIEFSRRALALGAAWLILQPPPVKGMTESSLAGFFAEVAGAVDAPLGLQLAPDYLSGTLSAANLLRLAEKHANVSILKVEMPALEVARLLEETHGKFAVFNGRAGLDMPDGIAAGCVGFVPGAESTDSLVQIYESLTSREPQRVAEAERAYKDLAPLLGFLMLGIDNFLVYGKTLMTRRLGLRPQSCAVRAPTAGASKFGLAVLDRWSRHIGALGEVRRPAQDAPIRS
jgi:2-keto-3-deoxy-L-arabinonate dehydratase